MNRFLRTLLLGLIIFAGAWALYHRDQINTVSDAWQLASTQLGTIQQPLKNPFKLARTSEFATDQKTVSDVRSSSFNSFVNNTVAQPTRDGSIIRVASFKLDSSTSGGSLKLTTDICQQYDVVAIQNSSGISISRLVKKLNQRGLDFRFVDQTGSNQKFAIIFNQQTIILDEQHWYTVNDPEDLFLHEPLVAWFRVLNAPPDEAFTFTLANVEINPREPDKEIGYLGELFRAIRNDGRGEDDIILAGDFRSSDTQLKQLKSENGLTSAIVGIATNTRNDSQLDNLVFDERATMEFTGDSGVFDFMKRFNMTLVEAMAISNRMPVWAEFAILEGRSPGRAAGRYDVLGPSR